MEHRKRKKKNINFLLENKHYQRLHLMVYLLSVGAIVLLYFLTILLFSTQFNILITGTFSLLIGIYLVFKKDDLVKKISEILHERKRKRLQFENKNGLKTTLRRITPKRDIKLSIGGKVSFKDKISKFKPKMSKSNKINDNYIEIK